MAARDTNTILAARKVIDMSEKIALLEPSATPFITFLKRAKANKEVATNPKFSWMEDDLNARWDAINNAAGYAANATSIDVDNGSYFKVGDVVKVPRTGECMLVTGISTNTLTVVRGYGTTAGAALVDNDPLVIIGNASTENAGVPTIKTTTEIEKYNYTQIFRTPFGVSGTLNATKLYGGKDLAYQRMKAGIEHMKDMARAFYFGERKEDLSGTHPRRTTAGLLSFLTVNNYDAAGPLTQDEFDQNICEVVFKYGSKEKLALCSARVLSVISGWANGKLETRQGDETFGLAITKYISPFGVLNLVHEPLFEGATYGGYAAFIDVEKVKYRPLAGRDTMLLKDRQANDIDGFIEEYLTEAGLEVRNPLCHALLTGVTS